MKAQLLAILAIGLLIGAGATQGDDQAEAKAVLDKAMKAMGGKEKLAKLSTVSMKGTILFKDQQQEATIHFDGIGQGTSKYRIDVQIEEGGNQKGAGTLVLNGKKGWMKEPNKTENAPEEFVHFFQDLFHAGRMPQLLPALTDKAYKLSHLGETKVGDQAAVGILVSHKDRKEASVYFDKATGLPLKTEVNLVEPSGEKKDLAIGLYYSDYKDFDGIRFCSKVTIKADGKELTMTLNQVTGVEKVEDSQFDRP